MTSISEQLGIELAEHVRTAAGAAFYGEPIGSLIVRHEHQPPLPESRYKIPDHDRLRNERSPYKDPADHPFFKANPVSAKNIDAAYDAATPSEKEQGKRWYEDAHDVAAAIAGGDAAKGAAMLAVYSPQAFWPVNLFNATRSLKENRALGPGEGQSITGATQKAAQKIFDGASIDEAVTGPKTNAFAHLLATGGDDPADPHGYVVIDRHAMSVAAGRRLTDDEYAKSPVGDQRYYDHVADEYRKAALARGVPPYVMQATTWLHQQNANQLQDATAAESLTPNQERLKKGRTTATRNAWAKWNKLAAQEGIETDKGTTALSIFDQLYDTEPVTISEQLDLAFNPLEPRDSHGRWTRFGGVGEAADVMMKNREGFSVSPGTGDSPASGYMVAQTGHTHTYPAGILDDHAKLTSAIDDMLMSEKSAFAGKQTYLGGWVHDGKLWLEPSDNIADKDQAVAEGAKRNQIAVFDLQTYDEIQTGGSGGGRITEHGPGGAVTRTYDEGSPGGAAGLSRDAGEGAAGSSGRAGHPDSIGAQLDLAEHVRTAAGAAFFHEPIGSLIVAHAREAIDSLAAHTDEHGKLSPERAALHEQIIEKALAGTKPSEYPVATFMGGGPASGKSEMLKQSPATGVIIDSDEIKKQLPEYQQMVGAGDHTAAAYVHEESSAIAKQIQARAIAGKRDFTLDGTGDSSYQKMRGKVDAARAAGYETHGRYVTVDTDKAIERIKKRGQRTGRIVPETYARETHASVSNVFKHAVADGIFDSAELWDNNADKADEHGTAGIKLIASKPHGGQFAVHDQQAYQRFLDKEKG